MRTVIFKNRTFHESNKRDVSIEETIETKTHITTIVKRSLSFIRKTIPIKDRQDLQNWLENAKDSKNIHKREYHVMKVHSDQSNVDTVICKGKGDMFFLVGNTIYNIVSLNIIRFEIKQKRS